MSAPASHTSFRPERRGAARRFLGFHTKRHAANREQEIIAMSRSASSGSRHHQEEVQFRIILAVTYPSFLVAAALQRLTAGRLPAGARRRSVFVEAKAMAVSAIPFVFMG